MKNPLIALLIISSLALAGCSQGTPGGEGVTTTPPHKAPMYGEADNTFNLSVPRTTTTILQGESKEVVIGIERGKNFDQDVALNVAEGPAGVTGEFASPVIKHGDSQAKLTFKAAKDASLGDFTVKLTGHPAKGADATIDFKIAVAKK